MDEKVEVLICLGIASAVNCAPCFSYYYKKARGLSLSPEEIQAAVALAGKVSSGARVMMSAHVEQVLGGKKDRGQACCNLAENLCCD